MASTLAAADFTGNAAAPLPPPVAVYPEMCTLLTRGDRADEAPRSLHRLAKGKTQEHRGLTLAAMTNLNDLRAAQYGHVRILRAE
jgi:hypothetical protein